MVMSYLRNVAFLCAVSLLSTCAFAVQPSGEPLVDNDFVQKEFGGTCSMVGLPALKADLDGDGVEDLVIPARCTSPMVNRGEFSYVVLDPYNSFFGYGNPKVTTAFVADDPARRGYSILVIHGFGPDAWYSATPKAKYMLVNIPFEEVTVKKLSAKKKTRMAIYVKEAGADGMTSAVFWDGRKYRYEPMGSSME
jgi:hypothetical protein